LNESCSIPHNIISNYGEYVPIYRIHRIQSYIGMFNLANTRH